MIENSVKITAKEAMDQALEFETHREEFDGVQTDYRVRLENFDGPLDLLLHLIRKDQIDIHNIPVSHICESYLSYLLRLTRPDVNAASEFFVMAATLLELKSEMLLPKEPIATPEEDPRLPLALQLLDYQRFKLAAVALGNRKWLGRDTFGRPEGAANEIIPPEAILDGPIELVGTFELLIGLKAAMDRTERRPIQIAVDTTSIRERVVALLPVLEGGNVVEFSRLLPSPRRRQDIIVTFLAILELARLKFVEISQSESLGPIYLRAIRPTAELNWGMLEQF